MKHLNITRNSSVAPCFEDRQLLTVGIECRLRFGVQLLLFRHVLITVLLPNDPTSAQTHTLLCSRTEKKILFIFCFIQWLPCESILKSGSTLIQLQFYRHSRNSFNGTLLQREICLVFAATSQKRICIFFFFYYISPHWSNNCCLVTLQNIFIFKTDHKTCQERGVHL